MQDWTSVLRTVFVSRALDALEETRLLPERKVLYQFCARGHDVTQVLLGLQLTGRVRALGFLFAPLFFAKKGPAINACVYIDQSVDWYRLTADQMPALSMPLVGTSIGIGAGSYF